MFNVFLHLIQKLNNSDTQLNSIDLHGKISLHEALCWGFKSKPRDVAL